MKLHNPNRREFLKTTLCASSLLMLPGCSHNLATTKAPFVMTVKGPIRAQDMGFTLTHEHLFANLNSYQDQMKFRLDVNLDEVVEVTLPYLLRIRELGCATLIDCTATHLGRNPVLLKRLSDASGINILTVTGNYLSADGRFMPPYVVQENTEQLAARWLKEWTDGIDGTGIRPAFIKLGMEGGPLKPLEQKTLEAAIIAHRKSGMTIGCHIGPWREVTPGHNAQSAREQIHLLEKSGLSPSCWIWIHAQNEVDSSQHIYAGKRGAWLSFDEFRPNRIERYVDLVRRMRDAGLLDRVLLSQDGGWYSAGEPRGGDFAPFHPIFTDLISALLDSGFTQADINQLFVVNPARAF